MTFRQLIKLRRAYIAAYDAIMAHWDSAKQSPHYPFYGSEWEQKRARLAGKHTEADGAWRKARDAYLESPNARQVGGISSGRVAQRQRSEIVRAHKRQVEASKPMKPVSESAFRAVLETATQIKCAAASRGILRGAARSR